MPCLYFDNFLTSFLRTFDILKTTADTPLRIIASSRANKFNAQVKSGISNSNQSKFKRKGQSL
ncbi:MAG: hypothetical protein CMR00_11600 [[Chlorobium] sp. 445]|nr:MAG: hypothetical protein CMR00_11600 [[Chlorobium] sp. 445]